MRRLAIGALLLAAGVTATAQGPEFRVEVRLVEVETRVTDSAGQPVPWLRRGDFTLQENGVSARGAAGPLPRRQGWES